LGEGGEGLGEEGGEGGGGGEVAAASDGIDAGGVIAEFGVVERFLHEALEGDGVAMFFGETGEEGQELLIGVQGWGGVEGLGRERGRICGEERVR
jgi:hypothetical protein